MRTRGFSSRDEVAREDGRGRELSKENNEINGLQEVARHELMGVCAVVWVLWQLLTATPGCII